MKTLVLIACLLLSGPPLIAQNGSQLENSGHDRRWAAWSDQVERFREIARSSYSAERSHEKSGECPKAFSTHEMVTCLDAEVRKTTANYRAYVGAIRSTEALVSPEEATTNQLPGSPLRPEERAKQFDQVESAWQSFQKIQCQAAYDVYAPGTIAPVAQLTCELRLLRDRMSQLESIYQITENP